MSGCGIDIESGSGSQFDSSQTDSLQTDSFSLSESQDVETQLPPVIFMKYISYTNASEEDEPGSSVSFFANDGSYYVSSDTMLAEMYPNEIVEEFEKGTLSDHITLHTQCEQDELKEKYLQISDIITSGDFQIIDPAIGPDVEASTVIWYGVYYDENGEFKYRMIHQTDAMGEHISDNDTLNEVYAWLLEHEKQDISDIG
jgi:hypothetical protein